MPARKSASPGLAASGAGGGVGVGVGAGVGVGVGVDDVVVVVGVGVSGIASATMCFRGCFTGASTTTGGATTTASGATGAGEGGVSSVSSRCAVLVGDHESPAAR